VDQWIEGIRLDELHIEHTYFAPSLPACQPALSFIFVQNVKVSKTF